MDYYIVFYLTLVFVSLVSLTNNNLDNICYVLILFFSILFIGGRYHVGADFIEYENIFKYSNDIRFDSGFLFLFKFFKSLGLSYAYASLLFYISTITLFSLAIKGFKYKTISVLFFILFLFVPLTSTIRQGLSIPFFILAINNLLNAKKYIIYSLVGVTFHSSAFILIPLYLLRKVSLGRNSVITLIIVSFFIGYLNVINYFLMLLSYIPFTGASLTKVLTYSTRYTEPMSLIAQVYRLGAIFILFVFWNPISKDERLKFCKNVYIFVFALSLIFKDNGVLINRISFSTNIVLVYIASHYYMLTGSAVKKYLLLMFFCMYFTINYFKFISTDLRHGYQKAYLPYENFILSDIYE